MSNPKAFKKIKLKEPIQHGSDTISELEFIKPKARHLRKLPANPSTSDVMDLAGRLCNQPPSVMDELSVDDFIEVMNVVGDFLPASQKTGSQS